MWPTLGWFIVTLVSARLKASMRFRPLRGMYQRGGTCKGCDRVPPSGALDMSESPHLTIGYLLRIGCGDLESQVGWLR